MPALSPLYIILKAIAYAAWCWYAVGRLQPDVSRAGRWLRAAGFGLLRSALGLVFGAFVLWLGGSLVAEGLRKLGIPHDLPLDVATYFAVYVPVRVLEWGVVSLIAFRKWDWRFVAGGIVISVVADVPWMIALQGLPLGRFMC